MRSFLVISAALALLVTYATLSIAQRCECPDDFAPVCGRDFRTYANDCTLGCAKQKKAYDGECRRKATFY